MNKKKILTTIQTLPLFPFPLPKHPRIANLVNLTGCPTFTSTILYPPASSGSPQKFENDGSNSPAQIPYASGTSFHRSSHAAKTREKSVQRVTSDGTKTRLGWDAKRASRAGEECRSETRTRAPRARDWWVRDRPRPRGVC